MEERQNKSIKKLNTFILIVGAGPSGLALACLLKKMGVPFIIIDQKSATTDVMKSIALSSRSLEIFSDLGLSDQAIKLGQKVVGLTVYHDSNEAFSLDYEEIPARFGFNLHLGQPHTEKILNEYLQKHHEKVLWEHKLVDFMQDDNGVNASILNHHNQIKINATLLIAADGAKSGIREKCHLSFDGETYPSTYLIANVKLNSSDHNNRTQIFFNDHGFLAINPLPDGLTQVAGKLSREKMPTQSDVFHLFEQQTRSTAKITHISWMNEYRTHCRFVKERVHNSVIFLGDAAQIVSPITGLGMNAGIQDAENIAWKLKLLFQNIADRSILQTYHTERHQLARKLASFSNVLEASFSIHHSEHNPLRNYLIAYSQENKDALRNNAARLMQKDLAYPIAFGRHAGKQAPDSKVNENYLFDFLDSTKHHIIIFSNTIPTWFDTLIHDKIISSCTDILFIHDKKTDFPNRSLFDKNKTIHQAFAIDEDEVFLIRPDRYIAYHEKIANQLIPKTIKQIITMR